MCAHATGSQGRVSNPQKLQVVCELLVVSTGAELLKSSIPATSGKMYSLAEICWSAHS